MIYGYFDGSQARKDVNDYPRTFCGLIGHEEEWKRLDTEWSSILDNPQWPNRPRRFHGTDCVNGEGDFRGWSWTFRHAIFTDLMNALIKRDLLASGVVVLPNALKSLPAHVQQVMGGVELLMMQHAIQTTVAQAGFRWPNKDVGLVFDRDNKETTDKAYWLFEKYREREGFTTWTSFAPGDSYKLTMLQAADMMAYGSYRFHKEAGFWVGPEPHFKVGPIMIRMVEKMPSTGAMWDSDKLIEFFVQGANVINDYTQRVR